MPEYPPDSIQNLVGSGWWEKDDEKSLCRGALVRTWVQFFSQIPMELVSKRVDSTEHKTASLEAQPLYGRRTLAPELPVAGLPRLDGADCFLVNRAKNRPCLVLGGIDQAVIDKRLVKGMSNAATASFVVVAPFFGVKQEGRAGYNSEFAECIKHAKFRQFFWDILPIGAQIESVLRIDQAQPLGNHFQSFEHTGFRLSRNALEIMDEWLNWFIYGTVGKELSCFRELIKELEDT